MAKYAIVGQGTCANGTLGRCTGSPVRLVPGSNTVTITTLGDFTVTMPVGTSASAANGSATLVSNPTTCAAAAATTRLEPCASGYRGREPPRLPGK